MKLRDRTFDLLTVVVTLAAAVMQFGGRLSMMRLVLIALIGLTGLLTLIAFRHDYEAYQILLPLMTAGVFALILCGLSRLYYDVPSLDRAASYIRQGIPFLIGFSLQILLLTVFLKPDLGDLLRDQRIWLQGLFLFACCMLLMGAYFPLRNNYYPSHDHAIFSYIGQQILRGRIPYTELWDHKPPLIFYIDALGLRLAGGSLLGIWLLELICLFAGAIIFFNTLKRRFSETLSLVVTGLGLLHYVRLFDFGNYCEEFSLFFMLCALGLWLREKKSGGTWFLIGVLCGLAFTCKQNTIGGWAAMGLIGLLASWKEDRGGFFRRLALAAGGFLLINGIWAVYFASKGALAAYWDVAFRFNLIYSENSSDSRLACAWTTLTFLPMLTPFLFAAFLSWFLNLPKFRDLQEERLVAWALAALPVELILAGLSGMNYQHYFILCIPSACVLLCAGLERLKLRNAILVPILILACFPLVKTFIADYEPRMESAYTKARDYLLENTDPEDAVLVWGSRSALYVMSGRHAPTAYFNERPLYLFKDQVRADQWDELLSDLRNDPPKRIIWVHDSALPFVDMSGDSCIFPNDAPYAQETYRFFCDNYRYDTTINEGANDAWEAYAFITCPSDE